MNRIAAAAVVAALALPGAGAIDPAERLIAEARRALRKEAYVLARQRLDEAIELAVLRGDAAREVRARSLLGAVLSSAGDGPGGARELDRAIDRARAVGDRRSEAGALRELGVVHWRRADYAAALRLAEEALAIQVALADGAGEGASLELLGRIDLKTGRTDDAVTRLERAYRLREGADDFLGEVDSRVALVLAHLERRDFRRAMAEAEAIRHRGEESADRDVEVEALCQIAIVWMFQGAPDAALASLDRARALASRPTDAALAARVAHLTANALRTRGDHEAAVKAHEEAIRGYEAEGNRSEVAWNLARRARSLAALHRNPEAEASLRRALEIWRDLGERRAAAYWTYEYGRLLETVGRRDEAWRTWEEALRRENEIELPYVALVLAEMAGVEAKRGALAAAQSRASAAVDAAERSGNEQMVWTALFGRALIVRQAGRREEALSDLRRCLAVIEGMRLRVVPIDEALVGFLEDKQEVFAEAVDLLMELGRPREALEVAERARARAFLDLLKHRPDPLPQPPRLDISAGGLGGSTIVEYFAGRARTFVWVIERPGRLHAITVPIGAATLAERIAALRQGIGGELERAAGDRSSGGGVDARIALRDLDRELWEPIARWLPSNPDRRVTIVPHGPLFVLPFASLIGADDRYVVESHTLDYAPSIAVLAALAASKGLGPSEATGCLVVANPRLERGGVSMASLPGLPGAEAEAVDVAASVTSGARDVLLGAMATESAVRSLAPHKAVLHFATHGLMRDDDPLASALVLTPSPGEGASGDGLLSAGEILDLRLSAHLVTLAACESGVGRVTGEGMLGLSRAFLHAGADSVVASLWRVSDLVGRHQMAHFYARLHAGDARATALRSAQLETIAALRRGELLTDSGRPVAEAPLLWAPFVLVGDGGGSLSGARTTPPG